MLSWDEYYSDEARRITPDMVDALIADESNEENSATVVHALAEVVRDTAFIAQTPVLTTPLMSATQRLVAPTDVEQHAQMALRQLDIAAGLEELEMGAARV